MKIAFDIRGIAGEKGGKGVWTANVLKSILFHDTTNEYLLYTNAECPPLYQNRPNVRVVRLRGWGPLWHWRFYRSLLRERVDTLVATESYIVPFLHDPRRLHVGLAVHDMIAFKPGIRHQKKAQWIEKLTLKKAVQKSRWIFTVSSYTRRDLLNQYPDLPLQDKITVVYAGVQEIFFGSVPPEEIRRLQKQYGIEEPYLMMTGALEPRKNVIGVLRAYHLLSPANQKKYRLVICGKQGAYFNKIKAIVQKLGLQDRVTFLEYLPEKELVALMQGATLFLFPSFYEGFGLPVLEAMQSGAPVVASKVSSIPELGMDAVHYIDPTDPIDIADGITQVLDNESHWKELRSKGFEQVKNFSWGKTAQRILEVIQNP
ncbi:glycosyltransferase family 4 protein [Candidatus Peregrinibacteria bacterium]|nr:glycosyltransferase family 4 protein [Candidatus Peregrinibacteria bacterium]